MRDSVTFIHAADLHLDAPFQGVSAENERVGRDLAEATYQAWERIVDEALARAVDFVLLAGDVYDTANRSVHAESRLRDHARRLDDAGIALYMVCGNHDPLSGRSAGLEMPENLHVFGPGEASRVEAVAEDGFVCAVYGRSFNVAAETEDFSAGYRRNPADTVAIGLLHSNVGGNTEYEPYAPCTVDALRAGRMDYWALGHIHKTQLVSEDPVAIYAGSPQGRNPKETGEHGCFVVTVSRSRSVEYEHVDLAPINWAQVEVDVTNAAGIDDVERAVAATLEDASAEAGRPVVARVSLIGATPAHGALSGAGALGHLTNRVRDEFCDAEPWVWIDRLTDRTSANIDADALAESAHFPGEVVRAAALLADEPERLARLVAEVSAPLSSRIDGYEPGFSAEELLQRARDRALSLLVAESEVDE